MGTAAAETCACSTSACARAFDSRHSCSKAMASSRVWPRHGRALKLREFVDGLPNNGREGFHTRMKRVRDALPEEFGRGCGDLAFYRTDG